MKILKAVIGATLMLNASFALSQMGEGEAGEGPSPYVDCGIGGALFPTTSWAAVTSNVIWDAGTTAVTSATMSPETCNGKSVAMAEYVKGSYASLEMDIISGRGAYLNGLSQVSGCGAEPSEAFVTAVRNSVKNAVSSESALLEQDKQAMLFNAAYNASLSCTS